MLSYASQFTRIITISVECRVNETEQKTIFGFSSIESNISVPIYRHRLSNVNKGQQIYILRRMSAISIHSACVCVCVLFVYNCDSTKLHPKCVNMSRAHIHKISFSSFVYNTQHNISSWFCCCSCCCRFNCDIQCIEALLTTAIHFRENSLI